MYLVCPETVLEIFVVVYVVAAPATRGHWMHAVHGRTGRAQVVIKTLQCRVKQGPIPVPPVAAQGHACTVEASLHDQQMLVSAARFAWTPTEKAKKPLPKPGEDKYINHSQSRCHTTAYNK